MGRTNRSARDAGTRFERAVADYLADLLGDGGIDRQAKAGRRDVGDIRGVFMRGGRVAVECKDYGGRHDLPQWLREATPTPPTAWWSGRGGARRTPPSST